MIDLAKHSYWILIHTLSIKVPIKEGKEIAYYNNLSLGTSNATIRDNKYVTFKINPNKCNDKIICLKQFSEVLSYILIELDIQEYSIIRLDIAFDTNQEFSKNLGLNSFLFDALRLDNGLSNFFKSSDDVSLIKSMVATRSNKSTIKIECYNKFIESKGKYPTNTRFEFRFIKLNIQINQIYRLFFELEAILNKSVYCIEDLINYKTQTLYNALEYQKKRKTML